MTMFKNDICYCHDAACPDKDRCYRYINRDKAEWASYAATLRDPDTGHCEYVMPIKDLKRDERKAMLRHLPLV